MELDNKIIRGSKEILFFIRRFLLTHAESDWEKEVFVSNKYGLQSIVL